jgi:rRNA maturation endonuclease Nob1
MGHAYFTKRSLFGPPNQRALVRRCLGCRVVLTGKPADRCHACQQRLRERKRRKPR